MGFYTKKPITIEAIQWDGTSKSYQEIQELNKDGKFIISSMGNRTEGIELTIPTLEGDMKASKGDWIIKGIKGEIYPCKPDIFEESYNPATRG